MKTMAFDLADDVFDSGDFLVVRFAKDTQRIPLKEIVNVKYSPAMSPPRVVLFLHAPGIFGKEVAFSAPYNPLPFVKSPVISALIKRIDTARSIE